MLRNGKLVEIPLPNCEKHRTSVLNSHFPKVGTNVLVMGNSELAVNNITRLIEQQERSVAWLSRVTGIPYKRLLAELKHKTKPMSLDTALAAAAALGEELPALVAA